MKPNKIEYTYAEEGKEKCLRRWKNHLEDCPGENNRKDFDCFFQAFSDADRNLIWKDWKSGQSGA